MCFSILFERTSRRALAVVSRYTYAQLLRALFSTLGFQSDYEREILSWYEETEGIMYGPAD